MIRSRVSVAALMGLILYVALGLAALMRPSEPWAVAFANACLALLTLSLLAWRAGRPGWGTFAVVGWAYFAASLGPWESTVGPRLVTSLPVGVLYDRLEYAPTSRLEETWYDYNGEVREVVVIGIDPSGPQPYEVVRVGESQGMVSTTAKSLRPISPAGFRTLYHSILCPVIAGFAAGLFAARNGRPIPAALRGDPSCDHSAAHLIDGPIPGDVGEEAPR